MNHRVVEYEGQQYPIPEEGLECYVRDSMSCEWLSGTFHILCRSTGNHYTDHRGINWNYAKPVQLKRKELSLETLPDDTRIYRENWPKGMRINTDVTHKGLETSTMVIDWDELNDPETPWIWWATKKPCCEVE